MKNQLWIVSLAVLLSACAPNGKSTLPATGELAEQGTGAAPAVPVEPAPVSENTPDVPSTPGDQTPVEPPRTGPVDSLKDGPEKYSKPWLNTETSIVIDAYQGNAIDWDKMSADARVVGVLHRSSIGLTADTQYLARKKIALQRGYLWGAYHLGRPGDPVGQAKFFLQTIGDASQTLLVLDLEDTSSSSMMSVAESVKFMEYIYQQTGRIPVVYANHSVTKALNVALAGNELFAKSRLWYARFRTDIPDFPKGIWGTYFLWQFSSEINCSKTGTCLYNVPGTAFDMDVNVFYGSKAALASQWLL